MGSAPNTPGSAPRTMSTKLLTMKFMQRAAASPGSTAASPDQPAAKRQKTSRVDASSLANQQAVEAALAAEEAKRQAALEKQANAAGDTRWVLSFRDDPATSRGAAWHIIPTGYAAVDADSNRSPRVTSETQGDEVVGRRSYGNFNASENTAATSDSDDSSDSSDDDESDDEVDALIKAAKKDIKPRKAKSESKSQTRTPTRAPNLNKLTSISGAAQATKQACHNCGEVGHLQAQCPTRRRNQDGNEKGRKKNRKS